MATVEKITVALTQEQAAFLRSAVDSGEFASTSEVVRDAVREWKERRDLLGYTVDELRRMAEAGLASGHSKLKSMADVKAEARKRLAAKQSA